VYCDQSTRWSACRSCGTRQPGEVGDDAPLRGRYDGGMGFGGLTFDKIFIVLLIALIILGPDKLPHYAQKFGQFVRSAKRMADGAKDRLRDEMGPEFDDVNWQQLDPRQYDPRRIIRDALREDEREAQAAARKDKAIAAAQARRARMSQTQESVDADQVASVRGEMFFDEEAT
jgi:sec-independent protein translocase protein TatB